MGGVSAALMDVQEPDDARAGVPEPDIPLAATILVLWGDHSNSLISKRSWRTKFWICRRFAIALRV